jgi:phage replication O-like protein O
MEQTNDAASTGFKGFRSPNTTPIPDEVFDELLADLSGAEVKVLLYICRRTFGWKKESDTISISQMMGGIVKKDGDVLDKGTGLSRDSVARAVKGLEQKGVIIRIRRRSKLKGDEPTTYALKMLPVSENRTPRGKEIGHGVVKKSDTQETTRQETRYKTVNGDESIFKTLPPLKQSKAKTEYVARFILAQLGDKQSARFYHLVAGKIPEHVIREALSEINVDGAREPAKLFTYKMKAYALQRLKAQIG